MKMVKANRYEQAVKELKKIDFDIPEEVQDNEYNYNHYAMIQFVTSRDGSEIEHRGRIIKVTANGIARFERSMHTIGYADKVVLFHTAKAQMPKPKGRPITKTEE